MNKKLFNIIGSFFLAGVLFSGCDQETEGTLFEAQGKSMFSVGSKVRTVEMVPEDNNSFKVEICRVDASASGNVVVSLTLDEKVPAGTFALKSNIVDFKAGEYVAYATVQYADINKLSPTGQFKMTLSIQAADATPSNSVSMAITAFRKLTYEPAGVAQFTSEIFEGTWPVDILKAKEGDVYILKELYDTGLDVQLVIVEGKASIAGQAAWKHSTYGNVYVMTNAPATVNGKTIEMSIKHYVPNVGSFGDFAETLVLP